MSANGAAVSPRLGNVSLGIAGGLVLLILFFDGPKPLVFEDKVKFFEFCQILNKGHVFRGNTSSVK